MSNLPTLEAIRDGLAGPKSPLAIALTILFEHSLILLEVLEPELSTQLKAPTSTLLSSYSQLIDLALSKITNWSIPYQSEFISGHPRIGETKNLSNLSAKEQGGSGGTGTTSGTIVNPTSPEVLARLKHLNICYEKQYPGLRYITFVNGRSRAAIAEEMENVLGIEHSLLIDEPTLSVFEAKSYDEKDQEWLSELQRAIVDIGKIAKSRLRTLGVE